MKISTIRNKILLWLGVCLLWVAVWFGIYLLVGNDLLLSSPVQVAGQLWETLLRANTWVIVGNSLWHILKGFFFGVLLGAALALAGTNKLVDQIFSPLQTVIKATPVASFIVLTWLWLEREEIPTFMAMLMVIPLIWSNLSAGLKTVNKEYRQMAKLYRLPLWKRVKFLWLPSLLPHVVSAVSTSAGLVWKAGIAAEILCQPRYSIGNELYKAKISLDTLSVFTWTTIVILISVILEKLIRFALGRIRTNGKML